MPKIDKDLQARMEDLGMEFVRNPPPPIGQVTTVVSEELIIGLRKIQEIVVPQFEKDFDGIIDPELDTEQFRRNGVESRGYRYAYLRGDTLYMGRETAEYLEQRQNLYSLCIIPDRSEEKAALFAGICQSDRFTVEEAYKDFSHIQRPTQGNTEDTGNAKN